MIYYYVYVCSLVLVPFLLVETSAKPTVQRRAVLNMMANQSRLPSRELRSSVGSVLLILSFPSTLLTTNKILIPMIANEAVYGTVWWIITYEQELNQVLCCV